MPIIISSINYNTPEEEQSYIDFNKKNEFFLKQNKYFVFKPEKPLVELYNKNEYFNDAKTLENEWKKYNEHFLEKLNFIFPGTELNIKVKTSHYGPGGSYYNDDDGGVVIITIPAPFDKIDTIKHEIIHLLVEPFIQKYKIDHQKKEKFVESIFDILK